PMFKTQKPNTTMIQKTHRSYSETLGRSSLVEQNMERQKPYALELNLPFVHNPGMGSASGSTSKCQRVYTRGRRAPEAGV
ncbi:hypothetical protein LTR60_002512, partial [Cryomyces antarcticus]